MLFFEKFCTAVVVLGLGLGATSVAKSATQSFADPGAFCRSAGTVDDPSGDKRYRGPSVPNWIYAAMHSGKSEPGYVAWRCLHRRVLACKNGGITGPCDKKDVGRRPTQAIRDWCRQNPMDNDIAAAITGHDTVYAWECRNGAPHIGRKFMKTDGRGFVPEEWTAVSSP